MTSTSKNIEAITQGIANELKSKPGALLPILHAVQDEFSYVPKESVPVLARVLNLSRAEVHGVISFYHLIRTRPPGEQTLYVCRSEACQAMGGVALLEYAKSALGVGLHETTPDGRLSLEPIFCLGNCACAPAVMLESELHGRVTPEKLDQLLGR